MKSKIAMTFAYATLSSNFQLVEWGGGIINVSAGLEIAPVYVQIFSATIMWSDCSQYRLLPQ